eukprot:11192249-Lingulodinium_polyedra.AAC.1
MVALRPERSMNGLVTRIEIARWQDVAFNITQPRPACTRCLTATAPPTPPGRSNNRREVEV